MAKLKQRLSVWLASTVLIAALGTTPALAVDTAANGGGGGGGGAAVPSGMLRQSLDPNSPIGNVPLGGQNVVLAKFLWTAIGEDIKVTSLAVSSTSDGHPNDKLTNARLLVNGNQVGTAIPSLTADGSVNTGWGNFGDNFIARAGTSTAVTVMADLIDPGLTTDATVVVGLATVSSNALGLSSQTPFSTLAQNANTLTIKNDLGRLTFSSISPASDGTVDSGTAGFELWRLSLSGINQAMEIRQLKFSLVGSAQPGDLKNFTVYDGTGQIGATVAELAADKTVTFDWGANPKIIAKDGIAVLKLMADVAGGMGKTFRATIQNSSDAAVYDQFYGLAITPQGLPLEPSGFGAPVNYTINSGSLLQQWAPGSPTTTIINTLHAPLAQFIWSANGEDIKISNLSVSSTITGGRLLQNVTLLADTSTVGAVIPVLTGNGSPSAGWGDFGNNFIIPANSSVLLTVIADTTDPNLRPNDYLQLSLTGGYNNGQGLTSLATLSSVAQNGNLVTVLASPTPVLPQNESFTPSTSTINVNQKRGYGTENRYLMNISSDGVNYNQVGTIELGEPADYTFTYVDLLPNTAYWLQTVATDGNSQATSTNTSSVHTLPLAPTKVTAIALSDTQIKVAWDGDAANFRVANNTATTFSDPLTDTDHSFIFNNLKCDTAYEFQVIGRNAAGGESASSSVASAATNGCPPPLVVHNFVGGGGYAPSLSSAPAENVPTTTPAPANAPAALVPTPTITQPVAAAPAPTASGQVLGKKIYRADELITNERLGANNAKVAELQTELRRLGFFPSYIRSTGWWGPITGNAVFAYLNQQGVLNIADFVQETKPGEKSQAVFNLQKLLQQLGFFPKNINATGFYGPITADAINKYLANK